MNISLNKFHATPIVPARNPAQFVLFKDFRGLAARDWPFGTAALWRRHQGREADRSKLSENFRNGSVFNPR